MTHAAAMLDVAAGWRRDLRWAMRSVRAAQSKSSNAHLLE